MTFRDDHDAALQRLEALESELERRTEERDQLRGERDQLRVERDQLRVECDRLRALIPQPKPKSAPNPAKPPTPRSPLVTGIAGAAVAIGIVLAVAIPTCHERREERAIAERAEVDRQARERASDHAQLWMPLANVQPCLHQAAVVDLGKFARLRAEDQHQVYHQFYITVLESNCGEQLLQVLPTTSPHRAVAAELQAVEIQLNATAKGLQEYYREGDFVEDKLASAPGRWAQLDAQLARRRAVLKRVIDDALLGVIRDDIRQRQALLANRADKSEVWWRIELALDLGAIATVAVRASGALDGRQDIPAVVTAIRSPVQALLDKVAKAPIEIRRALRQRTYLEAAMANPSELPDSFLFDLVTHDRDILYPVTPNDVH